MHLVRDGHGVAECADRGSVSSACSPVRLCRNFIHAKYDGMERLSSVRGWSVVNLHVGERGRTEAEAEGGERKEVVWRRCG